MTTINCHIFRRNMNIFKYCFILKASIHMFLCLLHQLQDSLGTWPSGAHCNVLLQQRLYSRLKMGRPRKSRNGSNPSKPSMVDLDDEPKFIELPDDYEEEPVSNGNGCDHGDEAPEENDKVQLKKEKKDKAKTNAKSTLNKPSQADEVKKDVKGTEKSDPPKPEIKNKAESADSQKANNFKNEAKTETKPEAKPVGDCAICDQLATLFCAGCKNVFYCSKEHQKKHWSNHKTRCKDLAKLPYRVSQLKVFQ